MRDGRQHNKRHGGRQWQWNAAVLGVGCGRRIQPGQQRVEFLTGEAVNQLVNVLATGVNMPPDAAFLLAP